MNNNDLYYKAITYDNVRSMWEIVRRTCKNKKAILRYTLNQNTLNYSIYQKLLNGKYTPLPYRLFLIFEPKERLVMSQTITDKIVNHFVANYYLIPNLENKLIDSNVATRKGKGSKYANKLLNDYINTIRMKEPNKDIFVLKIDISKYFYTISHDILMEKLAKYINDKNVLKIIKTIISETDKPYINRTIVELNKKYNTNIPLYKKGIGLSIGAMTSQFLAIFYLNDLDHYIKEELGCKYYIRYMDDFVIIDTNKEKLKKVWSLIKVELEKLKLQMNPKSSIINLKTGINFLGYKYRVNNNKYRITYKKKTITRIKKKLITLKKYDLVKYYKSYASYYGYLNKIQVCERNFLMSSLEKYNYFKEKYSKKIIFIRDGRLYRVYDTDVETLKDIFNIKANYFNIYNIRKVFDYLKSKDLGYIVIDSGLDIIEI